MINRKAYKKNKCTCLALEYDNHVLLENLKLNFLQLQ